ncbi:MAG: hypothetical protein HY909_21115 [Deltaproteobacteria bacterium]|nr:hypothetical protein [Deltaproteobacteria bacterium]
MKGLARLWVGVGVSLFLGCSSGDTAGGVGRRSGQNNGPQEPRAEPMPHEECASRGGDITPMDVNNDGQADIRTVMEGGRAVCRESDLNFDGRVDVVRWMDANGRTTRVEDDYDFDGRVDAVITYADGEPRTDVLDTNFDGRTDTWREYRGGRVVELRRDADGDGAVDTWERFDDTGRLTYAAMDNNHDGHPDEEPDAGAAAPGPGTGAGDGGAASPPAPAPPAGQSPAPTGSGKRARSGR